MPTGGREWPYELRGSRTVLREAGEKFPRSAHHRLHWCLNAVMNKDDCRIRRVNAAELFSGFRLQASGIRHIAVKTLQQENVFKAGLRRKMRKAAMDDNYLATVLAGCGGGA